MTEQMDRMEEKARAIEYIHWHPGAWILYQDLLARNAGLRRKVTRQAVALTRLQRAHRVILADLAAYRMRKIMQDVADKFMSDLNEDPINEEEFIR